MNSESQPNKDALAELLLQWEELYEHGTDTSASELAKEHPHLIPELSRLISALKTVSRITNRSGRKNPANVTMPGGAAGKTLGGRYRLEQLIAEGGFAEVYKAYDTELQRTVAAKISKRSRVHSTEVILAEARRVAKLKHDGIVPVYDVGVEGNACFIISEFVEGGSLADRLSKGRPSFQESIRWISEVADALDYAHLQAIVHRDVKPANILIDHHGRAKLADFGIAHSTMNTGEFSPSLGTLRYMSPEQLEGKAADHRSDIFSLGLVLHEAMTGKLPYSSLDPNVIRREVVAGGAQYSTAMSGPVASCIRKATSRSPHVRHSSAGEFARELRTGSRRPVGSAAYLGVAALAVVLALAPTIQWQRTAKEETLEKFSLVDSEPTDRIGMVGLGPDKFIEGSVPAGWVRHGVFAEIDTPGAADFPRIPESAYVMEADLTIRNPRGRIAMFIGEPKCNVEICMGDLWEQDSKQDKIATRLFRGQPFGVNWWREAHLEANERTRLTLVVADDTQVLFRNGQEVLRARGDPTDFTLRLAAVNGANATIYRLSCRALTVDDARKANVDFPARKLRFDIESTRKRLKVQIPNDWPREPVSEQHFTLGEDLAMRWIAPAEFTMGCPNAPHVQSGRGEERVRFSRGYWIGAYEVTQGQWRELMGDNPSRVTGSPLLPVNQVSWSDAKRFCTKLTERERKADRLPDGYEYRLPTEAEWEYASRAGEDREFVVPLKELACRGQKQTHLVEVGTTPANAWGLHEVLGNVAEWCLDQWRPYPEDQELPTVDRFHEGDPSLALFVVRGNGFWYTDLPPTVFVRAARHDIAGGFRGFRLVLGPERNLRYGREDDF